MDLARSAVMLRVPTVPTPQVLVCGLPEIFSATIFRDRFGARFCTGV